MKNLGFFGYHGALKEENVLGQKFFVDIELYVDLQKAGKSDSVVDTVHYGQVYELVKNIVENERFSLIEALGESIAQNVIDKFDLVEEIRVVIKKPEAPVRGIFDYFGVDIRRKKYE